MNLITNSNNSQPQFTVVYQPLVCLTTGKVLGFEALLRWQHPTKGSISPADFIPIAEDTGLIVPLGNWVLKTAIRQMWIWQKNFPFILPKAKIAVNLSGKQLLHNSLIAEIEAILEETGLDPDRLKLEITESLLMENFEPAVSVLKQLSKLGIELLVDDFGTGYSSLGRLQSLPIDTLKIDRCFVAQMDRSVEKLEIVKAIANMAQALKIKTIVEGIETPTQLAMIRNLNCHEGQGYYFAKPLDARSITTLLANKFHWMDSFADVRLKP